MLKITWQLKRRLIAGVVRILGPRKWDGTLEAAEKKHLGL